MWDHEHSLRVMTCPDENTLDELARGELPEEERVQLEAHLDECPSCSEVVVELTKIFASSFAEPKSLAPSRSSSGLDSTADGDAESAGWSSDLLLPEGAKLGRYVVLKAVGAGAMGVVYAAYDPQLDRKVALKVMRRGAEASTDDSQSDRNARMLREAQALARLSHPGVITVHDVGSFEGQVFLAMEFVAGGTLTEWLQAEPRNWRQVRRVFRQAGEGLAAAHKAGLVHRDFKPDNVLIHDDGRAVVTDFGLARSMSSGSDAESSTVESSLLSRSMGTSGSGSRAALAVTLTRTGALVGTPAYMAPEQLEGQRSDALSDQFGFCVALYEGLYGERPFKARDLAGMVAAVFEGRIPPAPRGSKVPRWMRRAVLRGLSVDARERHPDIRALLLALRPKALATWQGVTGIGVLGVVAGGAGVGLSAAAPEQPVAYCDDVAAKLQGVWDPPRRAAIVGAFAATELPFAPDVAQRVNGTLDAYADQWVRVQTDACQADVDGHEPPAVVAARMTCLARRRATLAAMTQELADADADTVMRAPEAVGQLPDLGPCLDAAALGLELPAVPVAETEAVEAVRTTLDEAVVQQVLGRVKEALAKAEQATQQAKGLQYVPVRAEATLALAEAQHAAGRFDDAEAGLHDALSMGIAGHHNQIVAEAAAGLSNLESDRMGPPRVTQRWVAMGLAALEAQGGQSPDVRANLLNTRALAKRRDGDLDGAIEDGRQVLKIREEHWGPEHYVMAEPLSELGMAYARKGEHAESVRLLERAREVLREAYGDRHPHYAAILQNLGTTHFVHGQYADALATYQDSHRLLKVALGPEHPSVAVLAYNVATSLLFMERYDEALLHVQRAQAIEHAVHGPRSGTAATSWALVGEIHLRAGRFSQAEDALRTTLSILDEVMPTERRRRANNASQLGLVLLRLGRVDESRRELEAALAVQRETAGEPSAEVAETQGRLALVYLAQGELPLAQQAIDASVEQYESEDPDPHQHAEARFRRARILAASGKVAAARTEAERARAIYAERADQPTRMLAVKTWLEQQPRDSQP